MTFKQIAILPLRPIESARLDETEGDDFTFADTGDRVPKFKVGPVICILVDPPTGAFDLAVITRGQRLSTFEWRYRVEDILRLGLPFGEFEALEQLDPSRGQLLNPSQSDALLHEIPRQAENFDDWYAFVRERHAFALDLSSHGRDIVRQQADATRMALQIVGFDGSEVRRALSEDRQAPFMRDLDEGARALEDAVIISDWSAFQDWDETPPLHAAVKRYRSAQGRQVTIVYANRTNIETSTGVDLVYYRHRPPGYLLVQYKMYEGSGDSARASVNRQFRKELRAMNRVDSASRKHANATCEVLEGYRLSAAACFVKFCYRKPGFEGLDTRLLSGDVVPTEHLKIATKAGVKSFTPDSVASSRLTASQFTSLATSGLFGTCGDVTEALDAFLEASLKDGRRAVLALESGE
ncbi:hypothetical protein [Cellulomonas sp. PSBB021]|uniref:hypothetical protein n=1 Tax=Cellulomonas sp. PSBB021 TaxID=2003551 RepID=UPI000B8D20A0|nr:hypothetical protein [Cellulomonas sp. PSBB021]ASR56471.1 hypothetical protein CBP52_16745 [Cellulomonas sp. PSBB021]